MFRASIFRPLFGQPLWGRGHRFQLGQRLGQKLFIAAKSGKSAFACGICSGAGATFRADPEPDLIRCRQLLSAKTDQLIAAETALHEFRAKADAMGKELAALKRA